MKIRNQLICFGVIPISLALIVVLVIHVGKMNDLSNNWVDRVRADMIEKENETLIIRTGDKANLSRLMFGKSIYNIDLMMTFSSVVSTVGFLFDFPLFYNVPPLGTAPGPLATSPKDGRFHNAVHSGWFNKGIDNASAVTSYETTHANLSNMDNLFYPLYVANNDYLNVYHGKESNGHYQTEPYTHTDFDTAVFTPYPSGAPVTGYDPRIRSWYYEAFNNGTKTILTDPYNDALTGDVLITMARRVNDSYPSEGVWGLDIYLDDLSNSITGGKILDNGQFYIVSMQGTAVLYTGIDLDNVQMFVDVLLTNSGEKTSFSSVWNEIITNDKFSGTFTKNGDKWYIATEKVIPSNLTTNGGFFKDIDVSNVDIPYIIVATVPESDIEKASNEIKEQADKDINTSLVINIAVIIVFIIIMVTFFWIFSKRIVEPLNKFELMMKNIQAGNLECNLEDLDQNTYHTSSDVGSLANTIGQLFVFLRTGNSAYWKGDMNGALANYNEVEKITGTENKRIMGSLENNRGAAYQSMKNFTQANQHYDNAVKLAGELITEEQDKNNTAEVTRLQGVLRNRKRNLASLGVDMMKEKPAIQESVFNNILEVIDLCSQHEDMIGLAKAYGTLGRYHTVIGKNDEALRNYKEAYDIIHEKVTNDAQYSDQKISLEYATYNLAEYYANQVELTGNPVFYNDALAMCDQFNQRSHGMEVPTPLLVNFIVLQLKIAEKQGRHDLLHGLQGTINNYPELKAMVEGSTAAQPKLMDFTIDISGSMSFDNRMNAVADSLAALYNHIFKPNDKACITTFNNNVTSLTNNQYWPKQNVGVYLTRSGVQWRPNYQTAFLEAVWKTIKRVSDTQARDPMCPIINVFILTDGSNTIGTYNRMGKSENNVVVDINRMIEQCRINLILFTIGNDYNQNEISSFVNSANQTSGCFGIHLKAGEGVDDIKDKFKTVEKIMNSGEINIESLA